MSYGFGISFGRANTIGSPSQFALPWQMPASSSDYGDGTGNPIGLSLPQFIDAFIRVETFTASGDAGSGDSPTIIIPQVTGSAGVVDPISFLQNPWENLSWGVNDGSGGGALIVLSAIGYIGNDGKLYPQVSVGGNDDMGNAYGSTMTGSLTVSCGTLTYYDQTSNLWTDPANPASSTDITIVPKTYHT